MRKGSVRSWGMFLFLFLLMEGLAGCLPAMGELVMPQPPAASPPPTALPVVAAVPPPVSHTVEGARRDCMLCHAVGAVESPPVPADSVHEASTELCSTCHALLPEPVPPAIAPPNLAPEMAGREDCLVCHKMGIAYAPQPPENHAGLPAELCGTCHQPGLTPGETPVVVTPPQVPHSSEDRSDCRLCHATGSGGAPQFPDDHHVDRASEVCPVCHAATLPGGTLVEEVAAPQVPHPLENRTDCRLCHETGVGDARQFPADHADRSNEVCEVCHTAAL